MVTGFTLSTVTQTNVATTTDTSVSNRDATDGGAGSAQPFDDALKAAQQNASAPAPARTTPAQNAASSQATTVKTASTASQASQTNNAGKTAQSQTSSTQETSTPDQNVLALLKQLQALLARAQQQLPAQTTTASGDSQSQLLAALQQLAAQLGALSQAGQKQTASGASSGSDAVAAKKSDDDDSSSLGETIDQILAGLAASLQTLTQQAQQISNNGSASGAAQAVQDGQTGGTDPLASLLDQAAALLGKTADRLNAAVQQKDEAGAQAGFSATATQSAKQATGNAVAAPASDATQNGFASFKDALAQLSQAVGQAGDTLRQETKQTGDNNGGAGHDATDDGQLAALAGAQATSQPPALADASAGIVTVSAHPQTALVTPAEQVSVQIREASQTSDNQIKIQLNPEALGKVEVQMNTDASGKTTVTVTADNRQTLDMLQQEARSLESALRDIGVKTDTGGMNFNLRDQGQDTRNQGKQGGFTQVKNAGGVEEIASASSASGVYQLSVRPGLDIQA